MFKRNCLLLLLLHVLFSTACENINLRDDLSLSERQQLCEAADCSWDGSLCSEKTDTGLFDNELERESDQIIEVSSPTQETRDVTTLEAIEDPLWSDFPIELINMANSLEDMEQAELDAEKKLEEKIQEELDSIDRDLGIDTKMNNIDIDDSQQQQQLYSGFLEILGEKRKAHTHHMKRLLHTHRVRNKRRRLYAGSDLDLPKYNYRHSFSWSWEQEILMSPNSAKPDGRSLTKRILLLYRPGCVPCDSWAKMSLNDRIKYHACFLAEQTEGTWDKATFETCLTNVKKSVKVSWIPDCMTALDDKGELDYETWEVMEDDGCAANTPADYYEVTTIGANKYGSINAAEKDAFNIIRKVASPYAHQEVKPAKLEFTHRSCETVEKTFADQMSAVQIFTGTFPQQMHMAFNRPPTMPDPVAASDSQYDSELAEVGARFLENIKKLHNYRIGVVGAAVNDLIAAKKYIGIGSGAIISSYHGVVPQEEWDAGGKQSMMTLFDELEKDIPSAKFEWCEDMENAPSVAIPDGVECATRSGPFKYMFFGIRCGIYSSIDPDTKLKTKAKKIGFELRNLIGGSQFKFDFAKKVGNALIGVTPSLKLPFLKSLNVSKIHDAQLKYRQVGNLYNLLYFLAKEDLIASTLRGPQKAVAESNVDQQIRPFLDFPGFYSLFDKIQKTSSTLLSKIKSVTLKTTTADRHEATLKDCQLKLGQARAIFEAKNLEVININTEKDSIMARITELKALVPKTTLPPIGGVKKPSPLLPVPPKLTTEQVNKLKADIKLLEAEVARLKLLASAAKADSDKASRAMGRANDLIKTTTPLFDKAVAEETVLNKDIGDLRALITADNTVYQNYFRSLKNVFDPHKINVDSIIDALPDTAWQKDFDPKVDALNSYVKDFVNVWCPDCRTNWLRGNCGTSVGDGVPFNGYPRTCKHVHDILYTRITSCYLTGLDQVLGHGPRWAATSAKLFIKGMNDLVTVLKPSYNEDLTAALGKLVSDKGQAEERKTFALFLMSSIAAKVVQPQCVSLMSLSEEKMNGDELPLLFRGWEKTILPEPLPIPVVDVKAEEPVIISSGGDDSAVKPIGSEVKLGTMI